jgi:hypothetical protein
MSSRYYETTAPERFIYGTYGVIGLCYTYGAIGSTFGNIGNAIEHEDQYNAEVQPLVVKLHGLQAQENNPHVQSDQAQLTIVHKKQILRKQIDTKTGTIQPNPTFKDWAEDAGHYGALVTRDVFAIGAVAILAIGASRGASSLKHLIEARNA